MKYNRLGDTGLLVSELSLGSWVTFDSSGGAGTIGNKDAKAEDARTVAAEAAYSIMKRAYDGGVNFFDNAEGYANGDSERIMGDAVNLGIERGAWDRQDLVLTTKIYMGADSKRQSVLLNRMGLSRKHIIEGLQASLARMRLKHVDVVFCHRFDPVTPIEEVVRAFNTAIELGLCFYWATSEWSAAELLAANEVATRLGLIPPCADQPEYSIFQRGKVETEFAPLYLNRDKGGMGLGLTTWSPLASGILTGKYSQGFPAGSRLSKNSFQKRSDFKIFEKRIEYAKGLEPIASSLGCTMGQLALAWCIANPHVSTVITGATDVTQVDEQLGAVDIMDKLTPDVMSAIDNAIGEEALTKARRVNVDKAGKQHPMLMVRGGKSLSKGAMSKL